MMVPLPASTARMGSDCPSTVKYGAGGTPRTKNSFTVSQAVHPTYGREVAICGTGAFRRSKEEKVKKLEPDVPDNPKVAQTPTPEEIQDLIRRRAYELYEQRGREHGRDLDDWLVAESDVARNKT